ncbi:MAG: hypothetical protein ACR2O6_10585, partial [Ilumatobacteraceae bacterium]
MTTTATRPRRVSDSRAAYDRLIVPQLGRLSMSRRRFLTSSLAVGGAASIPAWFPDDSLAGPPLGNDDHILVAVMLAGGVDYLNTIVPAGNGHYLSKRGSLAVPGAEVLDLGGG